MSNERISVVMAALNARRFLDESIGSILAQTHKEFEFVIRDDGSSDQSSDLLYSWAKRDSRIRLFQGSECLGPAGSSNWVVQQARTPLVARMDADDIAHPERLQRQLSVFRNEPDVVLAGTLCEHIDVRGARILPPDRSAIARGSAFPAIPHGSIMFRRDAFHRIGGYRPACDFWEDLDFIHRISRQGRVLVLAEVLYSHRFNPSCSRLSSAESGVERALELAHRCRLELRQGRGYDALLRTEKCQRPSTEMSPELAHAITTLRLWAGITPAAPRVMWRRLRLKPVRASARALIYLLWANLSPSTLRLFCRLRRHVRNFTSARQVRRGRVYEWQGAGSKLRETA